MRINSELPVSLLEKNNELNEYDFVLYHLYLKNKTYREYFLKQRKQYPTRLMILDNSSYEFFVQKKKFKLADFVEVIKQLKPDFYILPDTLMDMNKTLEDSIDFIRKYAYDIYCGTNGRSEPLAVIQGNSQEELLKCLKMYKAQSLRNIAIPFHNKFFSALKPDKDIVKAFKDYHITMDVSDDMSYAIGRVQFTRNCMDELKKVDHLHFLGSHDPYEKAFYRAMFEWKGENVTMDTGYPVKIALNGWKLGQTTKKPDVILDDFLDKEIDSEILNLISDNVKSFRNL